MLGPLNIDGDHTIEVSNLGSGETDSLVCAHECEHLICKLLQGLIIGVDVFCNLSQDLIWIGTQFKFVAR